jgi:hypothetical protein
MSEVERAEFSKYSFTDARGIVCFLILRLRISGAMPPLFL